MYEVVGIKIFMEKVYGIYFFGMEIDWEEGFNNRGFFFNNFNVMDICGCGIFFFV